MQLAFELCFLDPSAYLSCIYSIDLLYAYESQLDLYTRYVLESLWTDLVDTLP
jgi:hypothetical protein